MYWLSTVIGELKYSLHKKTLSHLRYSGVTSTLYTLFQGIFELIISVSGLVDDRENSLIINNLLILLFTNIIINYI